MAYKSLVCLVALFSVCAAQFVRLDPSRAVPLHYNIETTIDINKREFISDGTILINLLQDANEIRFFTGVLQTEWFASRLEPEDGRMIRPTGTTIQTGGGYTSLIFEEEFKGGLNYTLHFYQMKGSFGRGLVSK